MNEDTFIYFQETCAEQSANMIQGLKEIELKFEDVIEPLSVLYAEVASKFAFTFGSRGENPLTQHLQVRYCSGYVLCVEIRYCVEI